MSLGRVALLPDAMFVHTLGVNYLRTMSMF